MNAHIDGSTHVDFFAFVLVADSTTLMSLVLGNVALGKNLDSGDDFREEISREVRLVYENAIDSISGASYASSIWTLKPF